MMILEKKSARLPWSLPKRRARRLKQSGWTISRRLVRRSRALSRGDGRRARRVERRIGREPVTGPSRIIQRIGENISESFYPRQEVARFNTPPGTTTELHWAAHDNSEDRIVAAIAQGYSIEAKDAYGRTPLMRAALKCNVEAFDLLLRHGANMYCQDEYGRFCEHLSAKEGHIELLERIIELTDGDALTTKDYYGRTPLHVAMLHGQAELFVCFLSVTQCDINAKDSWKRTPLHLAYKGKNPKIAAILEKYGADSKCVDIFGKSPEEIITPPGITTELHWAAHDNSKERILAAIKNGYNMEAKDAYGRTPLMRAALKGNIEAFDLLLTLGANMDCQDEYGRFCEHLAAKEGHIELLEKIIKLTVGDALTTKDYYGRTPLHVAMLHGQVEILDCLLSHSKCDINAKDSWKRTQIHLGYKENNPSIAAILEKYGADPKRVEIFGKTPKEMCKNIM